MFSSVFRPYGPVWNFLNHVTDVLGLSILWCFCCLPIVTIAPATTALYDATVRGIRYGEEGPYRRFFHTFRREWKQGVGVSVLFGLLLVFGSWVLAMLDELGQSDRTAALMAGGYRAVLLIPLAAACWAVTIQSRFSFSFRGLIVTAVRFLPAHLLSSAVLAVFTWLVFWFCNDTPIALTFAPVVCTLAWSLVTEPVFRKYNAGVEPTGEETA